MIKTFRISPKDISDGLFFIIQHSILQDPSFPQHRHANFAEIMVILGGKGLHTINGRTYAVTAGDVFVLKQQDTHGYEKAAGLRLFNVIYDTVSLEKESRFLEKIPGYPSLFKPRPGGDYQAHFHLSHRELARVSKVIELMKEEWESKTPGYQVIVKSLFLNLVVQLSRLYSASKPVDRRDSEKLEQVVAHLTEHFAQEMNIDQLARIAGMSVSHFFRVFKRKYQRSPKQYLIEFRIYRACELLLKSKWSITRIAMTVGFSDSNYFCRQFKKEMGDSPTSYRNIGHVV
jgi:AraC-like DNA-binding protein